MSQVLAQALPPEDTDDPGAFPVAFSRMAEILLNQAVLHIGQQPHRLAEIEVYWTGPGHPDPFTHCDATQREFGLWYFHKVGNTYKGGTYKGLDIAIGGRDRHAGVLVRALTPMDDPDALCDGSCSCVDHILQKTGHESIQGLADTFDLCIDAPEDGAGPLYLEHAPDQEEQRPVYASPRVGLTLKKGVTPERCAYLARPYRFLTEPARIKKGRPNLALGLHAQGHAAEEIASLTTLSIANVRKYIEAYKRGVGQDPARYSQDSSTEGLCGLLGAVSALG